MTLSKLSKSVLTSLMSQILRDFEYFRLDLHCYRLMVIFILFDIQQDFPV
jgi:hypothetical protein